MTGSKFFSKLSRSKTPNKITASRNLLRKKPTKNPNISDSQQQLHDELRDAILSGPSYAPIRKKSSRIRKKKTGLLAFFGFGRGDIYDEDEEFGLIDIPHRSHSHTSRLSILQEPPPHHLSFLQPLDVMLMKRNDDLQMTDKYNYGIKYEVFNGEGEGDRVLILAERVSTPGSFYSKFCTYPFYIGAFNFIGDEVFKLEGDSGLCGIVKASLEVQDKKLRFGQILEKHRGSEKYFEIHDTHGKALLEAGATEHRTLDSRGVIDVTTLYRGIVVARVSPHWNYEKDEKIPGEYVIEFTKDFPVEIKIIMIGIAVAKDIHFFGKFGT